MTIINLDRPAVDLRNLPERTLIKIQMGPKHSMLIRVIGGCGDHICFRIMKLGGTRIPRNTCRLVGAQEHSDFLWNLAVDESNTALIREGLRFTYFMGTKRVCSTDIVTSVNIEG